MHTRIGYLKTGAPGTTRKLMLGYAAVMGGAALVVTLLFPDELHRSGLAPESSVEDIRAQMAAWSLILMVAGVLFVRFVSQFVTRPLGAIVKAAERVAKGDLTARASISTRDEVGYLAATFNAMVTRLGSTQGELLASNRLLEQRVLQRTAELKNEMEERTRAEEQRRESEKRFQTMFEAVGTGIALLDMDGRIAVVNPAFVKLLGYSPAELCGRQLLDLSVAEDQSQLDLRALELLSGVAEHVGAEFRMVRKNGSVAIVHGSGSRVTGPDGFLIVTLEDLTERKALEERCRQAQKMEAVGRLAGGVAHDFNNLLTTINGLSELVLEDLGEHSCADDVREIRRAGERAASLTRQLLAFSRRQVLQPKLLDVNEVVREVAGMLQRTIGEHIAVDVDLAESLPLVKADPGQIAQVLMNLAANARDAMDAGGTLRITTTGFLDADAHTAHAYETMNVGPHVGITVRDAGRGMDAPTLAHAFDPFFTTKETGHGSGLGLATVYGIVRQSGGGIRMESVVGLGTTVHVLLPAANEGAARPAEPMPAAGTEPLATTILLVEDESAVRKLLVRVLQRGGYRVLQAANGAQAERVAHAYQGTIDLVVTDIIMPEVSGPSLVARLTEQRPALQALFISGYSREDAVRYGALPENTWFLSKPTAPDEILHCVERIVHGPARLEHRRAG